MEIIIILTPERYEALTKTAELHLPDGTPEEYLQGVIDSACDSYVRTYPEVSLEVYKDRAARAEAAKKAAEEKVASLAAEKASLEQSLASAEAGMSIAERLEAL